MYQLFNQYESTKDKKNLIVVHEAATTWMLTSFFFGGPVTAVRSVAYHYLLVCGVFRSSFIFFLEDACNKVLFRSTFQSTIKKKKKSTLSRFLSSRSALSLECVCVC